MEILYTYPTTHAVISAEQILLQAGLPIKIIPVPNVITAGCGLCLHLPREYRTQAETQMTKHAVAFSAVYEMNEGQYRLLA